MRLPWKRRLGREKERSRDTERDTYLEHLTADEGHLEHLQHLCDGSGGGGGGVIVVVGVVVVVCVWYLNTPRAAR